MNSDFANIRRSLWLIPLLAVAGCVTPEAEVLSRIEVRPPSSNVTLLLDAPARRHKTVAILRDTFGGTPEEINARLVRKAQEIGADAVLIVGVQDKVVTDWHLYDRFYHPFDRHWPHYRPIRRSYRETRARALIYLE